MQKEDTRCEHVKIFDRILLSDAEKAVKSGDLILFNANRTDTLVRRLGHTTFSHVGIVVEKDGEPYVYEIIRDNFTAPAVKHQNVVLLPLHNRISDYAGECYISSLRTALTDDQKSKLLEYTNRPFTFVKTSTFPLYLLGFKKGEKFCSELISDVLRDIGISDEPSKQPLYNIHRSIVDLCGGTIYAPPVQCIPDCRVIKNMNDVKITTHCSTTSPCSCQDAS